MVIQQTSAKGSQESKIFEYKITEGIPFAIAGPGDGVGGTIGGGDPTGMFFESDFRLKNHEDRQVVEDIIRRTRGQRKLKAITGTRYEETILRMQDFIYLCGNETQLSWFKKRLKDNLAKTEQGVQSKEISR